MNRKRAPFRVIPSAVEPGVWVLWMRHPLQHCGYFSTQRMAIDYAYRHWPYWP